MHGDIFNPSPYCYFYYNLIKYMFELIATYGEIFIQMMLEDSLVNLIRRGEVIVRS